VTIKTNKSQFGKRKRKEQEKEINGKPESPRDDVTENYRKHSINDVIKES